MICLGVGNVFYLYNYHTNESKPTTYDELEEMTGIKKTTLAGYKSRGNKIPKLDMYLIDKKTPLKQKKKWYGSVEYKGEQWKIMKDNPKFKISNYGRVKSERGFLLPDNSNGNGLRIMLSVGGGKTKTYRVARLVYENFIRELKPNEVVIFKNKIKTDCYFNNLKAIDVSKAGKMGGKTVPVAKIDRKTNEIVDEYKSISIAGKENHLSVYAIWARCHDLTDDPDYIYEIIEQ